jgi:antitoxin VapB
MNGGSQAVRLPLDYRFRGRDVFVQKAGDAVILFPKDKGWETFLHGLDAFTDDFMADGRDQGAEQKRETL